MHNTMKIRFLLTLIIAFAPCLFFAHSARKGYDKVSFRVMEYNVENLFDCRHDTLKNDSDFLPEGSYRWTHSKYWRKLNAVARAITLASTHGDSLLLPDIIGLCEIENDSVLSDLTRRSLLRGAGYEYLATSSPDLRGIDVALLYQPVAFRPVSHTSLRITPLPKARPTRDILYVKGETLAGILHVFVLHAPSRSGGEAASRPYRLAAAERLLTSVDSLRATEPEARILVMGDFNDYPGDPALAFLDDHGLTDVAAAPHITPDKTVRATYRYRGLWGSLDHVLLSPPLLAAFRSSRVAWHNDLVEPDEKYGGVKPFRFFFGPTVHGGFSDHLPLEALFSL